MPLTPLLRRLTRTIGVADCTPHPRLGDTSCPEPEACPKPVLLRRRWLITFAFGLVHGFGFSFALRETLQFAGSHLLVSLLSFNVGVEIGQILVLALSIPALTFLFRRVVAERLGTVIVSVLVAHTAWHWMVDRGATLALVQWPSPVAVLTPTSIRVLLVLLLAGGLVWLARWPWRQPVEALLRQARPWRESAKIAEPD